MLLLPMPLKCPHCGKKIKNKDVKICPSCGKMIVFPISCYLICKNLALQVVEKSI